MLRDRYPDVPSLLAAIRTHPGMFLGHATVRGLGMLLAGIHLAEEFHGVPAANRIWGFDREEFEQWVASRYNPRQLTCNSFSLAAHLTESEDAGFELWFAWHDEFRGGGHKATCTAEPGAAIDGRTGRCE